MATTISGTSANNTLTATSADDTLLGFAGNDTLIGSMGNEWLDGGLGIDSMTGGLGNDTYVVDNAADVVVELGGGGTDTIQSLISYTLSANVENMVLLGTAAINGTGNSLANEITGNSGNNRLEGGVNDPLVTGADTLAGGEGDDVYVIRATSDVIIENSGEGTDAAEVWVNDYTVADGVFIDTIRLMGTTATKVTGNDQANELIGNSLANSLVGGAGNDTFKGGAGADTLDGGAGDDVFVIDADGVADSLIGGTDTDTVLASVSYTLSVSDIEKLELTGTAAINGTVTTGTNVTLTGNSAANSLTGGSGADTLDGGLGNDTLNGGTGADSMKGGAGDDTYVVDDASDTVNETVPGSGGVDTVQASVSFTLGTNVEHLVLTGAFSIDGTGNELANKITGNIGANTLTGGAGNDTLMGGGGNDRLQGDAGNDSLDGGADGDTMAGGAGDDIYVVDNSGDTVYETVAGSGGVDTVQASVTFTLGDNVENLVLTGTAAINGTGNTLNNKITGNSGNNKLDGGAGVDTLDGGLGDDTYVVNDLLDRVIESSVNGGTDTVQSSVNYTLGANLENLKLAGTGTGGLKGTGNTLANSLTGGAGNDTLDGGTNKDTMAGGDGDDTYYVDNAGDVVVESSFTDSGNDTVITSLNNASLQNYANVENLTLAGSALVGFGDVGNNKITGNALNNTLTGNGGADTLDGGAGNDTLVVDSVDDVVIGGAGTDTVQTSSTYSLALVTDVENLTLTGTTNIDGTGNNLANVLAGNTGANSLVGGAGADTLDGGDGADTLDGGEGGDTYIVKTGYDPLTINDTGVDSGTDTVQSAITLTLGSGIENLVLTGTTAINGTGNGQANKITGNSAANILDGGTGADTLDGGAGNDLFKVDNANDFVIGGAGTDTVEVDTSAASVFFNWTLAPDVEHLTTKTGASKALNATGNALANQLTGTAQDDTLDGGAGADTLNGGAGDDSLNGGAGADSMNGGDGNDIYMVDDVKDVVVDSAASTNDWVMASVNYTLGGGIEKLTLTGTALSGTGNALHNTLIGNDGANTLNGGAGNDTMAGGNGNDVYFVDSLLDVVTEESTANQANAGTADEIRTTVTLTALAGGVERVTLLEGALDATGNELNNLLTGNSSDNELSGGAGADTLNGGAGADMLRGGEGDDTYIIDATDTVIDTEGTDTVQASFSYVLADELENLTLTGAAAINGTGNSAANVLTGNAGANILDGGTGADTMAGGAGNDVYYVDNAGDVVTEESGKGADRVYADVNYTLTANVEHLTLLGLALTGTGNDLANQLIGNDEANTLSGGAGNDTLDGGVGSDTMIGGTGDDVYVVDDEADTIQEDLSLIGGKDTVRASISHTLTSFVENLVLIGTDDIDATGNELANTLTGNSGANRLDGGAGADTMDGGLGDDTYVVDDVKDKIVETSTTGGADTIEVWLDTNTPLLKGATWVAAANIENVVLMGSYNSNATGNKLDNMLLGNSGNNVLNGDAGADFMAGGAGDDTYDIDSSDTVFEEANEGTDTVKANFSYTLNDNFENLILTSKMADNATGNGLANQLTGNDMANTLNGKAGNDTLVGGLGNDIFRFDTDLSSNTDTIQDFVVGQDRISLENSIFKGLALGKLKAANFALGSAPADANDYIIYDATTGNLYYDEDGNGGADSLHHFATLVGMPALTEASFIVT